jgi:hypothetical protein
VKRLALVLTFGAVLGVLAYVVVALPQLAVPVGVLAVGWGAVWWHVTRPEPEPEPLPVPLPELEWRWPSRPAGGSVECSEFSQSTEERGSHVR